MDLKRLGGLTIRNIHDVKNELDEIANASSGPSRAYFASKQIVQALRVLESAVEDGSEILAKLKNKAREQLADLQGSKKHKVEIRFGSDSAQSDMYESEDDWEEFTFDTEAELTAFIDGMSAMDGWDGFDQKE